MRRILLLVVGVLALALVVPAGASAHRGHGHGPHKAKHGHTHHHKKKAKRARHFGAKPGDGDAATIASFADGTLTLTLANGSTVSGAVTDDTFVGCVPAAEPAPTAAASHRGGWGGGDDDDEGDDDGDHGGGCGSQDDCDASDLVAGAVVHEAILKLGADGPEFKLVLLRKQADA